MLSPYIMLSPKASHIFVLIVVEMLEKCGKVGKVNKKYL
jgi:hypothetical protein